MITQDAYQELLVTYEKIQCFLDASLFEPEINALREKQEMYGERIYQYNKAIIGEHSKVLKASIPLLETMISEAREARKCLEEATDTITKARKIARALDKLAGHIGKLV